MPEAGGGTDDDGAGGYTGGAGESNRGIAINGEGGNGTGWFGGAGYYSAGKKNNVDSTDFARIGGQGASCASEFGGDGGIAGNGGTITVSSTSKIYAYNGNKYTDGTSYNDGVNQATIYAQDGTLRAVYKNTKFWNAATNRNYEYFSKFITSGLSINNSEFVSNANNNSNKIIRAQTSCTKTGYINSITHSSQGIGSGAGYIEISNGTYTVTSAE